MRFCFGADELLAVVQEDAPRERVLDDELGHAARFVDLANAEAAGERVVERDVPGDRIARGE